MSLAVKTTRRIVKVDSRGKVTVMQEPRSVVLVSSRPVLNVVADVDSPFPALGPVNAHRAVAIVSGDVIEADASVAAHAMAIVGISTSSTGAEGGVVMVCTANTVNYEGWSWTAGQPVFVSTGGALVQGSLPPHVHVVSVGVAVSPTSIHVNVSPVILRG